MGIRIELEGITPGSYQGLAEGDWEGYQQTRLDERMEKHWEGLQRLFHTGPGELGLVELALCGGVPVDNPAEDHPCSYVLSPRLVRMIAAELAQIDDEDIRDRCASTRWERGKYGGLPSEDIEESMVRAFHYLVEFFTACAEAGDGALRTIG